MKNELEEINKKFYTHIFVMLISLTFLVILYIADSSFEQSHPFHIYIIAAFIFSLLAFLKDMFKKAKIDKSFDKEDK